jgi:hypothetical protein
MVNGTDKKAEKKEGKQNKNDKHDEDVYAIRDRAIHETGQELKDLGLVDDDKIQELLKADPDRDILESIVTRAAYKTLLQITDEMEQQLGSTVMLSAQTMMMANSAKGIEQQEGENAVKILFHALKDAFNQLDMDVTLEYHGELDEEHGGRGINKKIREMEEREMKFGEQDKEVA